MNRAVTGTIFCFISAILYSSYFLSASIIGAGTLNPNYNVTFDSLKVFAVIALIIGVAYLAVSEYEYFKKKKKD
ncbi:hypothetical protein GMA19_04733 [Paenibacillus polymyxa E681]|uniref:hypothetical protein n=1 Tax=Paenibacillus polymyxa TaxID=1406 RepID=UPI0005C4C4CB|nr:hypothetical protein [Paenibacillus polymyxa]ADM72485.2 hypothetical protein PPE_04726 [Paenibacillus polymyxa E681]QNV59516.1 hypothetical protein GE561_04744 [Paenibacillus polymyxa E681]QNV64342.1 hypothetical protein GMA19_04733 [Paenibacillus polymyxa E681]